MKIKDLLEKVRRLEERIRLLEARQPVHYHYHTYYPQWQYQPNFQPIYQPPTWYTVTGQQYSNTAMTYSGSSQ